MLLASVKIPRIFIIPVCLSILSIALVICLSVNHTYAQTKDEARTEFIKSEIERTGGAERWMRRYDILATLLNKCDSPSVYTDLNDYLFLPLANTCINASLATPGDPTFVRATTNSLGSGISSPCMPLVSGNAASYDTYTFNLAACNTFPTVVTATTCGPAGCAPPGNTDTVLYLYRSVPSGNALTANGGLSGSFNPAAPCTNLVAANDDRSGSATNPGGATCNQNNTSDCLPICTGTTATSGVRRTLGSGLFTVVISGFSNTTAGNYNLFVDAPGAGCTVTLLPPTAAAVTLGGRVVTSEGRGIRNAVLTLQGGSLDQPRTVISSTFGYYRFEDIQVGETYIVSIRAKRYTFKEPARLVNLLDELTDFDFVSDGDF